MDAIKDIIDTKTFIHSSITTLGTMINGVLGVIFFVILARSLGAENFGSVSLAIATTTLIADISDLGINTGLINFISKYLRKDMSLVYKLMKFSLELKLIIWLIILILGWVTLPFICNQILLKPDLLVLLRLSLFGVGSAMLFSFTTNTLQAFQKFSKWSILNIFSNLTRLLLLAGILYFSRLTTFSSLSIYIAAPLLGFVLGLFFMPRNFLLVSGEGSVKREFFHYNKWVALSIAIAAVSSRVDSYLTARFLTLASLGVYSVATQLVSFIPQLNYAIASVVAPKLGGFDNISKAENYLKKLQAFVILLAALGLLAIPLAGFFIPILYGETYHSSIIPFDILLIGQLLFFIAIPAHQAIFYYFAKPKIFFVFTASNLLINFLSAVWLIPKFSVIGASLAMLIGNLFLLIAPSIYVLLKFKNK